MAAGLCPACTAAPTAPPSLKPPCKLFRQNSMTLHDFNSWDKTVIHTCAHTLVWSRICAISGPVWWGWVPGVEGLLGIGRETLTEHVAIPALPCACRLRALGTGVPEGERKVVVRPGLVAGEAQMPAKAPQFAEENGRRCGPLTWASRVGLRRESSQRCFEQNLAWFPEGPFVPFAEHCTNPALP